MKITKAKAFVTDDGATHVSLEAARFYALRVLLGGMGEGDADPAVTEAFATFIVNHPGEVRALLPKPPRKKRTPKTPAVPKPAKTKKSLDTGRGTFTDHSTKEVA